VSAASSFERCVMAGGVVVFPADTVYGLACDPANRFAVERLYLVKRRPLEKPSAVMFFSLAAALEALPWLGERTRSALSRLMPGGVSVLLPNPDGVYPLACGEDPATLGVRVVDVPALSGVSVPVLQSSANQAGGAEPRRLEDVHPLLRASADLEIDGGELGGTASTVIDLRRYESDGEWSIVREGAVSVEEVDRALAHQFHFDPETYAELIRAEIPEYDALQDAIAAASGDVAVVRILELGTGTGETALRLLSRHRSAELIGIDESASMISVARSRLSSARVTLSVTRLEDPLPSGPFSLVASALCVHHLDAHGKASLFARVREVLSPGGRFVLGDVVVPEDPADATVRLSPGYDMPDSVADQLLWLSDAGFEARVVWSSGDLAVIVGETVSDAP
jgi:tRNA threonylcarbamoyl adenosine modification protein (Sua5/YciO/YrdC/YwlC family)